VWTDACGNFIILVDCRCLFSSQALYLWQYNPANINGSLSMAVRLQSRKLWNIGCFKCHQYATDLFGSNSFTDPKTISGCLEEAFIGLRSLNDVWRFVPDTIVMHLRNVIAPPVCKFQTSDTILCTHDCISFANLSSNLLPGNGLSMEVTCLKLRLQPAEHLLSPQRAYFRLPYCNKQWRQQQHYVCELY